MCVESLSYMQLLFEGSQSTCLAPVLIGLLIHRKCFCCKNARSTTLRHTDNSVIRPCEASIEYPALCLKDC